VAGEPDQRHPGAEALERQARPTGHELDARRDVAPLHGLTLARRQRRGHDRRGRVLAVTATRRPTGSEPPPGAPRTPLLRDVTRLKVVHRQRVARQGDAEPAPPFHAAAHRPATLASAVTGWQRLLDTEYESVVIASWMTSALARLGAP